MPTVVMNIELEIHYIQHRAHLPLLYVQVYKKANPKIGKLFSQSFKK